MGKVYQLQPGTCIPGPSLLKRCTSALTVPNWNEVREEVRQVGLQDVGIELARRVLVEAMEQEADECTGGPKGKHLEARQASRHGRKKCRVPYGAALMEIERPRVRAEGKEVPLSTYLAAHEGALSPTMVLQCCIEGSSQRGLPRHAERLQGTQGEGFSRLSKSTVNRRFVRAAKAVVAELQSRPLGGERYVAIYLDGLVEQGHHVISALGLTTDGRKRVLGLREGSSESGEVCAELLRDLLSRGLDVGEGFLAVIDGGKGLASALKEVFGKRVLIQRCRAHKLRNVLEKVPEGERERLKAEIQRAWAADFKPAKRMLKLIAADLERRYPLAAGSLREGLKETLTCNQLDLPHNCALTRFLVTTNPLESLYARHTDDSRRVCRWRNGAMLLRWAGTSLALAEASFATVEDKNALSFLKAALAKRALQASPTPLLKIA